VIDGYTSDPGDAVADADMVFIAVPLGAIARASSRKSKAGCQGRRL
jgi:predicted dinucleotide-binding enzyme